MGDEITYFRRELLAGMQMLEWALLQIYVLGAERKTQTKAPVHRDPESIRALKLIDLMMGRGHHWFRDMIADFAPMHAGGEHLGMAAAKITDYQRSHDIIWTQCFMNACVDLTTTASCSGPIGKTGYHHLDEHRQRAQGRHPPRLRPDGARGIPASRQR